VLLERLAVGEAATEAFDQVLVDLDVALDARLAEPIEVAVYFLVSEALANAAKHAQASRIAISLGTRDGRVLLSIPDDGVGGADAARAALAGYGVTTASPG